MPRIPWMVLLLALLASCADPTLVEAPTPTADDRRPTTDDRSATALAALPTSVAPTAALPTSAPPTAVATSPLTAAATNRPPPAALNPQDQAPALLPDFRGDLDQAGQWNRYTISAAIDPATRTIAGRERLEYTNRDTVALDRLYFHLYPNLPDFAGRLDVSAVAVDGQAIPVTYELRRYLLRVDLPQPLAPGTTAVVTLDFATRAPLNASRQYGAFNSEAGVLALASSYPIAAIVRGGAWDIGWPDGQGDFVNSETALYEVTLTAPADWKLVTTGAAVDGRLSPPLASPPPGEGSEGGYQIARIVSGPQRDFMISAARLGRVSADVDGTRVSSYYRPGDEAGGQVVLEAAANALRAFNARYGRYPLAELDLVEVNARTFLGVEYPGVILMQSNLYDQPKALEITVAHEVGHQWWYSQVGNDVQTEAWLDEALASYSQIVYQEQVGGPAAAERELEGFRQRYRDVLAAGRDAPIAQPTAAFRGNYVALVYGKAVLFFQAMREQIGDTAFDRFLHAYYARHRYGFVAGADLLASAEGACSCELDGLYADWITRVGAVEIP